MTNENIKYILLKLLSASSAEEIDDFFMNDSLFNRIDKENWKPLGSKTNLSLIENLNKDPINALIEKIINSIDHLLIKECKLKGINPESNDAPKTMREAAEKFFGVKDGDLSLLEDKDRRLLAENIKIVSSGLRERPSITIIDCGEGQHYSKFAETILSLPYEKSNKSCIPFVQGRFNQGGYGALRFCGSNKYQLILSRKHPKLLSGGMSDNWGFTLIRKRPYKLVPVNLDNTWYEYLANDGGEIFNFPADSMLPQENIDYGMLIKLYSYDFGKYSSSNILLDLWRDLNRKIYAPALPVMLKETREWKEPLHGDTRILMGNKFRIKKDEREKVKETILFTSNLGAVGQKNVEVVVFKDVDDNGKLFRGVKKEFATDQEAVFFTMNGQTHISQSRSFLNKINLDFIKDYLLIHVDLTGVPREIRDELITASREGAPDGSVTNEMLDRLIDDLKENNILRRLNEEYKSRFLNNIKPEKGQVKKIVGSILRKDRSLAQFLNLGKDILVLPIEPEQPFKPNNPPTYFYVKIPDKGTSPFIKDFPENRKYIWIKFTTDAHNDYLFSKDGGKIIISEFQLEHTEYLDNGTLWLKIYKDKNFTINDVKNLKVFLTRPATTSLEDNIVLKYIDAKDENNMVIPPNGFDFMPASIKIKNGGTRNCSINAKITDFVHNGTIVNLEIIEGDEKSIEISTKEIIFSEKNADQDIISKSFSIKGKKEGAKCKILAKVKDKDIEAILLVEVVSDLVSDERSLPEFIGVIKENWPEGWDDKKIAEVKSDVILINMDCAIFHDYIVQDSKISKKARENLEKFYKLGIGLNALVLNMELDNSSTVSSEERENIFNRAMIAIARVILPINMYGRNLIDSPEDVY